MDVRLGEINATVITGTGGVTLGGGVANDSVLLGVIIAKNGVAATATIAGFQNEAAAAKNIVLTGSTADDRVVMFPQPIPNVKGALVVTASVADVVTVLWRARP